MYKVVNCKLIINRFIGEKEETSIIEGKGYYKIIMLVTESCKN